MMTGDKSKSTPKSVTPQGKAPESISFIIKKPGGQIQGRATKEVITEVIQWFNQTGDALEPVINLLKADDFGTSEIGLGRLLKDPVVIGMSGAVLSLALTASGLLPLVPAVLYITANDIKAMLGLGDEDENKKKSNPSELPPTTTAATTTTIDTTVDPVATSTATSTSTATPPTTSTSTATPPTTPDSFSTVSLGIIDTILDRPIPEHIAISAITRCGKTLTLRALIFGILQREPDCILRIIDPKNSTWMGLERRNGGDKVVRSLCSNDAIEIDPLIYEINRMHSFFIQRTKKQKEDKPKYWLIIDEWYSLLPKLKKHEEGEEALDKLNDLVQMGLERGFRVVLITQSHQCKDFGFNSQARFAFRFLSLARQEITETIDSMLNDHYLIPDKNKRDNMKIAFDEIDKSKVYPICCLPSQGVIKSLPDFQWLEDFDIRSLLSFELDNREEEDVVEVENTKTVEVRETVEVDERGSGRIEAEFSDTQDIQCLEYLLTLTAAPKDPACASILRYMQERGIKEVNSRQLQRAGIPELASLGSEEILVKLQQLSIDGYGELPLEDGGRIFHLS
jgi:hypothetical protein